MAEARRDSTLTEWLEAAGLSSDYRLQALTGGDINETALLTTACGRRFCLKRNFSAPADFFAAEAAGLAALASCESGLRIPEVKLASTHFLLLEYLEAAGKNEDYWQTLGAGLAAIHSRPQPYFGFAGNNYCGLTAQPNPPTHDGHAFFAEHRLGYQAKLAFDGGRLSKGELERVEKLATRLPELVPEQAPALLHGDLWGGNIHRDEKGNPALIDPAAYNGWPEADLAMTLLFGGFAEGFYGSYLEHRNLETGWRDRVALYNLYHLLNHLNLFGGGYHSQVMAVVSRYA